MRRALIAVGFGGLLASCEPELGDVPYACADGGACPEGFTCRSSVCVRDGARPGAARVMRVSWINASEMYWFTSPRGGATLVVNDGFTEGGHGLYEIRVSADGDVGEPKLLVDLPEGFPTPSAVVALDDARYGVLTLEFPRYDANSQRVSFREVERESGGAPATTTVLEEQLPFVGGTEPPYVSAIARKGGVDLAYADPSEGGKVVLRRIENGAVSTRAEIPLGTILPLSADCLLWDLGDALALRVGLESTEGNELFRVPDGPMPAIESAAVLLGQPVYAFDDRVVTLATAEAGDILAASYEIQDWAGNLIASVPGGMLTPGLEPFSGYAAPDGVVLAPYAPDAAFATLGVLRVAPDGSMAQAATIARAGTDELYSARAFAAGGRVYLAWTSFHESLMDLWVAVAPGAAP